MLILIWVLTIIMLVVFVKLMNKYKERKCNDCYDFTAWDLFFALAWAAGVISFIMIIVICCIVPTVATAGIIDEKIAMYQEENALIEQDIDRIVTTYLKHEQDTFKDLKIEGNSITLVTLFPELKADTLIMQQLDIYVANNREIKILREKKINITKFKWILYFGK